MASSWRRALLMAGLVLGADTLLAGSQFRAATESVEIPVTVVHKKKNVAGLTAADFQILEDGQPVKITDASVDARPLDVTLLLDVSESTSLPWIRAYPGLVAAAAGMQRLLRPDDTFAMYRLAEKLAKVGADAPPAMPGGQTALFDGILETLLQAPSTSGQIIIVLTDGLDTASVVPRPITLSVVDRNDAVVHVVAMSLGNS